MVSRASISLATLLSGLRPIAALELDKDQEEFLGIRHDLSLADILELLDDGVALVHAGAAVQHQATAAEDRAQVLFQRVDDLTKLGED